MIMKPSKRSTPNHQSQKPTWLDNLEQFCWILDHYLRWPIQVVAILMCFALIPETAWRASLCILAVGNTSTIGKLIDKIPGPN